MLVVGNQVWVASIQSEFGRHTVCGSKPIDPHTRAHKGQPSDHTSHGTKGVGTRIEPRNTPSEARGSDTKADIIPGRLTVFLVVTTGGDTIDKMGGTTSCASGRDASTAGVSPDIATAPLPAGREPSSYLSFFFFKSVNTLSILAFNTLISLDCSAKVLA